MRRIATALVMVSGLTLGLAGPARAETFVVSQTADTPPANPVGSCLSGLSCSLREAVTDANDNTESPGADTVQLPPGTYTLTNNALPQIPGDVTIEGAGGAGVTTITGAVTNAAANQAGGALSVNGASAKLTIRGVTISGNKLTGTANVGGGAIAGGSAATIVIERAVLRNNRSEAASSSEGAGAIVNDGGSVTISDSAIEDNVFAGTTSSAAAGGVSLGGASGVGLVVSRSSISRNRVDPASGTNSSAVGGLEVNVGSALSVTDSTVSQNTVSAAGATDFRTGGIDASSVATTTLTNVTVTDNVAGAGSGFTVNGISLFAGTTKVIRNSIIAGGAPLNCFTSGPAISSSGGNLEDANTCNFTGPGDLVNTSPLLEALRFAGGLGLSQEPLPNSPALGRARPEFCSAVDQTGLARPQGGGCDSGAVETAAPPVNTAPPSIAGTPTGGQTLTCSPGAFTENPTLAFQWLSDGAAIPGATGSTFTIGGAQLDTAVQCRVTATNFAGSTVATSAAVVPPKSPAPPVTTVRPSFTGLLRTGQKLTCAPGTFTGATSSAVSWLRNGSPIGGATAAAYTLAVVDVGKAIQCRVTATGPGGSVVAESAPKVPAKACIVPRLLGKTLAAARKALTRANCALGKTKTCQSRRKPRTVLASSPAKGRNLPSGTKVALTLAKK